MTSQNENTKLAVIANDISYIKSDVAEIKANQRLNYVSKDEFEPVKRLVNGVEKDHGFSFGSAANQDPRARIGITLELTAGDACKLQGWTEAGSSALDAPSFFCGFLVGK